MLLIDLRNPRITTFNYSIVGNKDSDVIYFYSHFVQYANANIYLKILSEYVADKIVIPAENISVDEEEKLLIIKWTMTQEACIADKLAVQLQFEENDTVAQSRIAKINLGNTLDISGEIEPIYPDILKHLQEEIDLLSLTKVDKVEGKGLSTNDFTNEDKANLDANTNARHTHSNKAILDNTTASFTTEEKTKLAGIQEGAQVNVLEGVKVNNQPLTPTNKVVNIDLTPYATIADMQTYGKSLAVSIDPQTYVLTMSLKDANGNTLNTQTVDLPLETMVVSGSYDDNTKSIILTLKNGQTITIPVGALISGLQSEITLNNPLSSDLVDDTTTNNHKFVTATEKTQITQNEADILNIKSTLLPLKADKSDTYTKATIDGMLDEINDDVEAINTYLDNTPLDVKYESHDGKLGLYKTTRTTTIPTPIVLATTSIADATNASDTKLPTEKAVRAELDSLTATVEETAGTVDTDEFEDNGDIYDAFQEALNPSTEG